VLSASSQSDCSKSELVIYQASLLNDDTSVGISELVMYPASLFKSDTSSQGCTAVAQAAAQFITVESTLISLVSQSISIQAHSTNFFW
jgi:hypothetical protein